VLLKQGIHFSNLSDEIMKFPSKHLDEVINDVLVLRNTLHIARFSLPQNTEYPDNAHLCYQTQLFFHSSSHCGNRQIRVNFVIAMDQHNALTERAISNLIAHKTTRSEEYQRLWDEGATWP